MIPPSRRVSAEWFAKRDLVDAADGEWVLVAEGVSHNTVYRINTGAVVAFRPIGAYEAVSRGPSSEKPRRVNVWVRRVQ